MEAAINDFQFSIEWPPLTKNRPGPDYDQHLQFELVNDLSGPVQVYMEMKSATEEEAIQHFEKKAEHAAFLAQIAGPIDAMTGQPTEPDQPIENPDEPATENENEGENVNL
jgi:hypothetical protein